MNKSQKNKNNFDSLNNVTDNYSDSNLIPAKLFKNNLNSNLKGENNDNLIIKKSFYDLNALFKSENNLFIPKGIYFFPLIEVIRVEDKYTLDYFPLISNFAEFDNILSLCQNYIEDWFDEYPKNLENSEKISNPEFVVWIFFKAFFKNLVNLIGIYNNNFIFSDIFFDKYLNSMVEILSNLFDKKNFEIVKTIEFFTEIILHRKTNSVKKPAQTYISNENSHGCDFNNLPDFENSQRAKLNRLILDKRYLEIDFTKFLKNQNLQKNKKKEAEKHYHLNSDKKFSNIYSYRKAYCNICCVYYCSYHFVNNYDYKHFDGYNTSSKKFYKVFPSFNSRKIDRLKNLVLENILKIEKNKLKSIFKKEDEYIMKLLKSEEYKIKCSNKNCNYNSKDWLKIFTQKEIIELNQVLKNSIHEKLKIFEKKDLYYMLILTDFISNPCFLNNNIFNNRYSCSDIGELTKVLLFNRLSKQNYAASIISDYLETELSLSQDFIKRDLIDLCDKYGNKIKLERLKLDRDEASEILEENCSNPKLISNNYIIKNLLREKKTAKKSTQRHSNNFALDITEVKEKIKIDEKAVQHKVKKMCQSNNFESNIFKNDNKPNSVKHESILNRVNGDNEEETKDLDFINCNQGYSKNSRLNSNVNSLKDNNNNNNNIDRDEQKQNNKILDSNINNINSHSNSLLPILYNKKIIRLCEEDNNLSDSDHNKSNLKNTSLDSSSSDLSSSLSETQEMLKKPIHSNFNYKCDINEYTPCSHTGKCTQENCDCIKIRGCCEKFCFCYPLCEYCYNGCECLNSCESSCPCKILMRDCDPVICHTGKKQFLNRDSSFNSKRKNSKKKIILDTDNDKGQEKHSWKPNPKKCKNMSLIIYKTLKTALSKSIITESYGLFAKENIKKDSFICEYVGELLSREETDRRSVFNDHFGLNYFFKLNEYMDIDAYTQGNEMR